MLLKLCDLSERVPHCGEKCFVGSVKISTKNIDPFSSYDVHRLEKHSFEKNGFKARRGAFIGIGLSATFYVVTLAIFRFFQ